MINQWKKFISSNRNSENIVVPEGTVANVGDVLVEIDAPGHEDNEGDAGVAAESQTPAKPAAEPTTETAEASAGSSEAGVFQFKLPDIGEGIAEGEIVNGSLKQEIPSMKTIRCLKFKTTNQSKKSHLQ